VTVTAEPATDIPAGLARFLAARNLTPRQKELAEWFYLYATEHGYSPTIDELADALGTSKVTAFEHVNALRAKGVLGSIGKHRARALYLRWKAAGDDGAALRELRAAVRNAINDLRLIQTVTATKQPGAARRLGSCIEALAEAAN